MTDAPRSGTAPSSTADTPSEIELKFRLDPARAEAVFAALSGEGGQSRTLTSIYYDTPRRALSKAGMALRVRRDGERWVQTLKSEALANGDMGRGEWETEVAGATPDLASLKKTPAWKSLANAKPLAPLFTVKVDRRIACRKAGGAEIEIALDRGEVAADGRTSPITELELELKSGETSALIGYAAKARRTHGLALSFGTKSGRGMALLERTGERAVKFRPPRLKPGLSAGGGFKAIARAALEQIVGNAERLAETPGPEVVHQMRVGVRRLRSALATFKPVVEDRRIGAIKAELKWLTGELDSARNLDVMLAGAYRRATRRKSDRTGLVDLGRRLRAARGGAYVRARSAAESERFADLVMETLAWIECGPWTKADAPGAKARQKPLADFAAKALARRWKKIARACAKLETLSTEQRHHVRIDAKKL
ncbi:MAG TPA: CYTH and CHAD domain-containing protein, partial [Caulobacteraceae bacterium]|nr:CYTH and CHAD domain-containing protein [Caulobacteraceae bacterium]